MNVAWAVALAGTILAVGWWGIRMRGGVFQYPFLAAVVFGGFVLVQFVGLVREGSVPPEAVGKVALMSMLCLAALALGYHRGGKGLPSPAMELGEGALLRGAAVLIALGAAFHITLRVMSLRDAEMLLGTGLPVALLFLGGMLYGGLAITAVLAFRFRSRTATVLTCIGLLVLLERAIFLGRRSTALTIVVMVLMPRWFERGRGVSRWAAGLAVLLGLVANAGIGEYRAVMAGHPSAIGSILEIPFRSNMDDVLAGGGHELRNAAYYLEAIDRAGAFDFGLYHWNALVFNFVPAQIMGEGIKQSLMLPVAPHSRMAEDVWGYIANTGSTLTGLVDSFASFWYFGCVKFFLIAYVMKRLYDRAVTRDTRAEIWYSLLMLPALLCITHNTQWILSSAIMFGLFLAPVFAIARQRVAHPREVRGPGWSGA